MRTEGDLANEALLALRDEVEALSRLDMGLHLAVQGTLLRAQEGVRFRGSNRVARRRTSSRKG